MIQGGRRAEHRRAFCVVCLQSKPLADFALNDEGQRSNECRRCAIDGVRHLLASSRRLSMATGRR